MTVTAVSWEGDQPLNISTMLLVQDVTLPSSPASTSWKNSRMMIYGAIMILSFLNSNCHCWSRSLLTDSENFQDILQTAHHGHPASEQSSRAVGASEFPASWGLRFSRGIWWVVFSERQRLWGRSSRAVAQGTSQCTDLPSMAAIVSDLIDYLTNL